MNRRQMLMVTLPLAALLAWSGGISLLRDGEAASVALPLALAATAWLLIEARESVAAAISRRFFIVPRSVVILVSLKLF